MANAGMSKHETKSEIAKTSRLRNTLHFPVFSKLPWDNTPSFEYYALKNCILTPNRHWCFIGEVHAKPLLLLRQSVWVRDLEGNDNIHVAFYPETGTFDYSDLKVGNTLCVRYAERHHFLDFTAGLRLEQLDFVMVIPTSLKTLLEISDFSPEANNTYCWICGISKSEKKLLKCGKCNVAKYCSKDCQISDWKRRHNEWCQAIPGYKKLVDIDSDVTENNFDYKAFR
ncbi:uncharacterized protein LOC111083001 isoform X2 [Limulus polyphemus]|nr:uncharacterized protein LOC111083001 isoform X2 [Limulus polyphemus]XP_022241320.1 uncharacterized protein LOC111083001 isoform X2 [Limulus polyphemus]XP_022241321.1 uncharacterized protein LOC111083001 isoform X2 [Limulus polyphemus]